MLIPLSQLREVEGQAIRALDAAFDRSYIHTAPMWVERCKADLAQLWRHGDLWAITEVQQGRQRVLHIVAMSGLFDAALVEEIETWGKQVGCSKALFTGRKGWAKKVPDYKVKTITFEKEI